MKRRDIGRHFRDAGKATRTTYGIRLGVVRPSRYRAKGDCTRFRKPVRLGLRQSSSAPELPVPLHRSGWRSSISITSNIIVPSAVLPATQPCNEVRLLSRRIIIRLLRDVKKKVQKNLRASMTTSSSSSLRSAHLVFACAPRALIASYADAHRSSRARSTHRLRCIKRARSRRGYAPASPREHRCGHASDTLRTRIPQCFRKAGSPHEQRLSGKSKRPVRRARAHATPSSSHTSRAVARAPRMQRTGRRADVHRKGGAKRGRCAHRSPAHALA